MNTQPSTGGYQILEVEHNGHKVKLRGYNDLLKHDPDIKWIDKWWILRPEPCVNGDPPVIGPFDKTEMERALDIAADYFSFGQL